MESSQYSYGAPGPSYEGPEPGRIEPPAGGPGRADRPAGRVPSHPGPGRAPRRPVPAVAGPPAAGPPRPAPAPATRPRPAVPATRPYPAYAVRRLPGLPRRLRRAAGRPPIPTPTRRRRRPGWCATPCTDATGCGWSCVTAVVAALVGGLVGAVVGAGSQQTIVQSFFPNRSVLATPQDIQEVLAKVEPAVVSIDSESGGDRGSVGGDFVEAAGTGMILTPDGEVLTNNHVVAGATVGHGHAVRPDQRRSRPTCSAPIRATTWPWSRSTTPPASPPSPSATRPRPGWATRCWPSATPWPWPAGRSVTEGIVSAENRSLSAQNDSGQTENLTGLLQTDAAINPGNSGGPLVNSQAQVVGMNTAVASSSTGNAPTQNIGFAITVDSVKPLLAQLRQGGTGGPGERHPSSSRPPTRPTSG